MNMGVNYIQTWDELHTNMGVQLHTSMGALLRAITSVSIACM